MYKSASSTNLGKNTVKRTTSSGSLGKPVKTSSSQSNLNQFRMEALLEKAKNEVADEKHKVKHCKGRIKRLQQQLDGLRREISSMSDQKKMKQTLERLKADKIQLDMKIDQMKILRRNLEENKEDMRRKILLYQEHEQEAEIANHHLYEANQQLEDQKLVLKRQFTQTQQENIELSHKYEKIMYEMNLKNQLIDKIQDQLKENKRGLAHLKDKNNLENNPIVQQRMKERETDMKKQMIGIQSKFNSSRQMQTELHEKVEMYKITLKDLQRNLRHGKKTLGTLNKKMEDKATEIFRLKKKIEDLLSEKSKHINLRMKHLEAERTVERLRIELDMEKSNRNFDEQIVEQFRLEVKRNTELQKDLKSLKDKYEEDMASLKEKYAREKEKLNLDPLFAMLGRKEKLVQQTLGKVMKTVDAIESALRCLNCMEVYDQPCVCVPCGHVFCNQCINNFEKKSIDEIKSVSSLGASTVSLLKNDSNYEERKMVSICDECKRPVDKSVYIHVVDVISSKVIYTKQNLSACFKLSRKKVLPTKEIDEMKRKYRKFEREIEKKNMF